MTDAVAMTVDSKRVFVHRLFSTIAPRYDCFNRLASLNLDQGWRRRAVATSELSAGMDVLDVCTGTGDLALLCADRLQGRGRIIGLDFNDDMLRPASRKAARRRASVQWMRGDALALPFRSGTFDRAFIGFSTRNLSDLRAGIQEMHRVLKPRGRLVILETGRPENRLLLAGYLVFLGTAARLLGLILTGRLWPFTYLARSVQAFLRPSEFVALMDRCGFQASCVPLSMGLAMLYLADKPSG